MLGPADDAAYRAAVGPLVGRIERSLGPEVVAVRARRDHAGWTLAPWRAARATWRASIRRAILEAPEATFAVADVRDCYASISLETITALLGPEGAQAVALLHGFRERGVQGLPVGPEPSAVLANAALSRLDRAIRNAGVRHLRWVDDVILWGSAEEVRTAMVAMRTAGEAIGLELHRDKTRVFEDREEAAV
ncbi:MAG TPA: RNA-directed DNA polymerase, partial [Actinomycetota bacterium]|nr:RNA-directed DNA polymerase [Actinomycetota bacterium]